MRFSGTITTPNDVFAKVLEFAARSFKQHGFRDIALLGDSGGNQSAQQLVAGALNKEWASTPVRVHHLTDYYPGPGDDWLKQQGVSSDDVGSHASIHDTASLLFLNPAMIRRDKLAPGKAGDGSGVVGNPSRATVEYQVDGFSKCKSTPHSDRFELFGRAAGSSAAFRTHREPIHSLKAPVMATGC